MLLTLLCSPWVEEIPGEHGRDASTLQHISILIGAVIWCFLKSHLALHRVHKFVYSYLAYCDCAASHHKENSLTMFSTAHMCVSVCLHLSSNNATTPLHNADWWKQAISTASNNTSPYPHIIDESNPASMNSLPDHHKRLFYLFIESGLVWSHVDEIL